MSDTNTIEITVEPSLDTTKIEQQLTELAEAFEETAQSLRMATDELSNGSSCSCDPDDSDGHNSDESDSPSNPLGWEVPAEYDGPIAWVKGESGLYDITNDFEINDFEIVENGVEVSHESGFVARERRMVEDSPFVVVDGDIHAGKRVVLAPEDQLTEQQVVEKHHEANDA
jgi:hypothetical protein